MASLSIRKLDDEIAQKLRERAAARGVSMEEEARRIIAQAVATPDRLGDLALTLFGPVNGQDLQMPDRDTHEPMDLGN